jgi:hypothetical protein
MCSDGGITVCFMSSNRTVLYDNIFEVKLRC